MRIKLEVRSWKLFNSNPASFPPVIPFYKIDEKFHINSNLFKISSSYKQTNRILKISFTESESKLVKLCKKSDAKAQFKLYKLYSKAMYNIAIRMTSDHGTAEDVIQDSFITAFSEILKLQNEKAFGGWLKRIVINRCIDVTRKKRIVFTDIENLSVKYLDIVEQVEDSVDPEIVHHFIKQLPEGARHILVMRALEGFKHAEIAEKLGISESTAKTQYFRAKQLLSKMIKEEINETGHGKIFEGESVKA